MFLGMVGLIAYDSCRKEDRTHATVVLDLGDAARDVREIDAELVVGGDVIGMFHRKALPGSAIGRCAFEVAMPETAAVIRLEVDVNGGVRSFERTIRPIESSTVTVPLEAALR